MVNEVNELGETALFSAAERGHIEVVKELLQYTTKQAISFKNRSGLDPLHIAASQGHQGNKLRLMLVFFSFFFGFDSQDIFGATFVHRD